MKKVLLVCLDNLGDLVFVSGLARALSQDPDVELSLWCKDYTSRVGHLLPGVKRIYAADPFWDRVPKRRRGPIRAFLRTWRSVRRARFDEAVISNNCWRTALFVRLAGIPLRYGVLGRRNSRFLTTVVPPTNRQIPVVQGLLEVYAPYLKQSVPPVTYLERERLPQLALPPVLQGQRLAVLHAFAGRADRCAPLDLWQDLAMRLRAAGYFILWTGTSQELGSLREQFPAWGPEHFVDRWAQDLERLAWLWAQSSLFVGHDSGPLHVAHALGVPVIGLYLPGQKRTFPQGAAPSLCYHVPTPAAIDRAELNAQIDRFLSEISA